MRQLQEILIVSKAPMHPMVLPFANAPVIVLDIESTGLDWWDRSFRVGGYVLAAPGINPVYIGVGHETIFDVNEDRAWVAESIATLAAERSRTWLMHNAGYDLSACYTDGIEFAGKIVDTMALWWTINSHLPSYALKRLGAAHVDLEAGAQERMLEQFIQKNKLKRYTQVPIDVMAPYAEQDGRLTLALYEKGMKLLPSSQVEVHETEQRWVQLLARMARQGLPIDRDLTHEIIDNSLAEAHRIRLRLAKQANMVGFNPVSSQQVTRAAQSLGTSLTDTRADTLSASSLPRDFRRDLIKYRQIMHTVDSYQMPMLDISRGARDGRVHTSFRTTTKTGRLASSDPINLQGLPRKDSGGNTHLVRNIVRLPEESGRSLLFDDFAQIDIRIGAHYAQDPTLMEVLRDPEGDVHTLVHKELLAYGLNPKTFTRSEAKQLVFGSQYGIGAEKFAFGASGVNAEGDYVAISIGQAAQWLNAHRRRFPDIAKVLGQFESYMRQHGNIALFDGRLIYCDVDEDPHSAFAWAVQGSGAQAIKRSMIKIDDKLQDYPADIILMVHDEVITETDTTCAEEVAGIVATEMAWVWPEARVPLYVQSEIGSPSWAEKKAVGSRVPLNRAEWEGQRVGN